MKVKIFSAVTTFVLLVSLLVVGVWALKQIDFAVTGEVKFEATGVEATISCTGLENGTLTEGTLGTDKLTDVKIDTSLTKTDLLKTFSPWQSLKLAFDEEGNDILLKLRITNDHDENFINAEVSVDAVITTNCTVSALNSSDSSTSALIYPGEYADFRVKLAVVDKYKDAYLQGFAVKFNLKNTTLTDIPTATSFSDTLTITCNESEETASVKAANKLITTANIPAYVRSANNVICAVTSIEEEGFAQIINTTPLTLTFSKNIQTIGEGAFLYSTIETIILESPYLSGYFGYEDPYYNELGFLSYGFTEIYVNSSFVAEGLFDKNQIVQNGDYCAHPYVTKITEENASTYGEKYIGYTKYDYEALT